MKIISPKSFTSSKVGTARDLRLNLIIEIDRHHIFCLAINPLDPDSSIAVADGKPFESNSVDRSHHSIERQFGKTRSRSVAER